MAEQGTIKRFHNYNNTMRRFYIEPKEIRDNVAVISGDEARHVCKVLRLGCHDQLQLFDCHGTTYDAVITEVFTDHVNVRIEATHPGDAEPAEIVLCQALLKSDSMKTVMQKSTELGVTRIVPFKAERSIPKWNDSKAAERVSQWQRVVNAAVKQSGIRRPPVVAPVQSFAAMLDEPFEGFCKFILWEEERNTGLQQALGAQQRLERVVVVCGPEGGFPETEIISAKKKGFVPISLGKYILRAETAPVAVLAALRYAMGLFG
ncbi:16S rRNA (uracil(1498)-N(3))-methyltransferase [Thermodesulfobacteriota bacterium]